MANFKMKGNELYDNHSRKIAIIRGNDIYDDHSRRVAVVRGNDIYDDHSRKLAIVKGDDIYDDHSSKIASMSNIRRDIEGGKGGATLAALWICFVRKYFNH